MSSNRVSTTKPDPRIAQKEAMVTRHKSAQMKRQLRTKDRSMKHLTNLLKSPTKDTQTPAKTASTKRKQTSPKAKQSLLQSVEKVQNLPQKTFRLSKVLRKEVLMLPGEEYYPSKRKRKLKVKKVVLKPNHEYKVVGEITGSVKRKCTIPRASDLKPRSGEASPVRQLTMAEAMSIMEEHLTDEDLMEILTCPSPVWWEDPPDDGYTEEALFMRFPPEPSVAAEPMDVDNQSKNQADPLIIIPNLSAKSDKFLKKRSKLEDLLGNIRGKGKDDILKTPNEVIKPNTDNEINVDNVSNKTNAESDDELMFHNSSMNEDELLMGLENMDIPIATRNDVIVIDDEEKSVLDQSIDDNASRKSKLDVDAAHESTTKEHVTVVNNAQVESVKDANNATSNETDVQKIFHKYKQQVPSPKSSDSLSSKSSIVSNQDVDTVSDTNIRFLGDESEDSSKFGKDSNEKICEATNNVFVKSIDSRESNKEPSDNKVTIYKIIEDSNGTEDTSYEEDLDRMVDVKLENGDISDENEDILEESGAESHCIVSANLNDYYKKISDDIATLDETDIQSIVASKMNEFTKKKSIEESNNKERTVEAELNDCYKKSKKTYQKKPKNESKIDINKNDIMRNAEEIDNFPTMFCDLCKPCYKRVSEDENVKYCLNCSSIFDTKDCTYCMDTLKNKMYICVPCKIKFCCDNFYKTHLEHGCVYDTVSRKIVFSELTNGSDNNDLCNSNVKVIHYSIALNDTNTNVDRE